MQTNGLYEASGLALWIATEAFGAASDDVCWADLLHFEDALFSKKVVFTANVTRDKKRKLSKERLTWPCEMVVLTDSSKSLLCDEFDGSLHLASGCFLLWGWYLAVFKALVNQDQVVPARLRIPVEYSLAR